MPNRNEPPLDTLDHNVQRMHAFERLEVDGVPPRALRGSLYRTGPGLLERFGQRVAHPFEADGLVTAVRFADDGVFGASRPVESPDFREEENAGRYLYSPSAALPRRMLNAMTGRVKPTGNTNLLSWQGHLLALVENALPVELDASTLDTIATRDFEIIDTAFSAHPRRVESLKTTFNFGQRGREFDLYAFPDEGPARRIGGFSAPWFGMVHDFIATDRHIVFAIGPAKLKPLTAMFGTDLSTFFRWDRNAGTAIVVVPLDDPGRAVQFLTETFWVWHFVNAFEDGAIIQVDLCRHDTFGALAAPSSAGPQHSKPELYRFALDPVRKTFRGKAMWSAPCEFPSVNPRRTGARQRYTWLQTFPDAGHAPGVARFDCETGAVDAWGAPQDHLGVEPIFVPDGEGEGDGWVLQMFQDPARRQSYLAVLDARRLADGPQCKVWFRQRVPMTFHGVFVTKGG